MSNTAAPALTHQRHGSVAVKTPARVLLRDEAKCVHCGACIGQCSLRAFETSPASGRVTFDAHACTACKLCVPACGYGALAIVRDHEAKGRGGR